MTSWEVHCDEVSSVLRAIEQTAQEYAAHRQRLHAAIAEVMGALAQSAVVTASIEQLAETVLLPQLEHVLATTTATVEGTRCAVAAYLDGDTRMAQHSLEASPRPDGWSRT